MKKYIVDEKLWHLSDEQLDDFLARYYKGDSCKSLIKSYEINVTSTALSNYLPFKKDGLLDCPNCNSLVAIKYLKRDPYSEHQTLKRCIECDHIESHLCRCNFCRQKRIDERNEHDLYVSNKIYEHCVASFATVEIDTAEKIPLDKAVALLAIARASNRLSDTSYGPLIESQIPFSPIGSFGLELLISLIKEKFIRVSEKTDKKNFMFKNDEVTPIYNYVNWEIQIENFDAIILEIEEIGLSSNLPNSWQNELNKFRRDLALAECKEFYTRCLHERKLSGDIGAQAEAMLLNILRDNSVAQCYQVIWNGAVKTLDFKNRQGKSSAHAANYMVGACLRYVDHARSEGWRTAGFRRNYNLPRSMISYVLYDVLLKIGERGFTEIYSSPLTFNSEIKTSN